MIDGVIIKLFDRFVDILIAPYNFPDMLWILTPLFLAMILLELYFARYKFEELGWNGAFGNALVLIFVALDLFRLLYGNNELTFLTTRNILVIVLTGLGVLLSVANFLHILDKELAYGVSDKLPINFLAYMAVIIIYSRIPLDIYTLISAVALLFVFVALILVIRLMVPKAIELDEDEYREREKAPSPR